MWFASAEPYHRKTCFTLKSSQSWRLMRSTVYRCIALAFTYIIDCLLLYVRLCQYFRFLVNMFVLGSVVTSLVVLELFCNLSLLSFLVFRFLVRTVKNDIPSLHFLWHCIPSLYNRAKCFLLLYAQWLYTPFIYVWSPPIFDHDVLEPWVCEWGIIHYRNLAIHSTFCMFCRPAFVINPSSVLSLVLLTKCSVFTGRRIKVAMSIKSVFWVPLSSIPTTFRGTSKNSVKRF